MLQKCTIVTRTTFQVYFEGSILKDATGYMPFSGNVLWTTLGKQQLISMPNYEYAINKGRLSVEAAGEPRTFKFNTAMEGIKFQTHGPGQGCRRNPPVDFAIVATRLVEPASPAFGERRNMAEQ